MKHPILISLVLLALGAYTYLADVPAHSSSAASKLYSQANEESPKKRQQEKAMLVDPATGQLPASYRTRELAYLRSITNQAHKTTDSEWEQRGPWNVGGRTRALAMDVTNEDVLVAAGVSGNIYRSEDQGSSWTPTLGMLDHQGIVSIAQDTRPGHQNKWYALGGEATGASQSAPGAYYFGDGVFMSTDSAKSWTPLGSTSGGSPVSYNNFFQTGWRMAVSPRTDIDVLYVCSIYGIRRSSDGGSTWSHVLGNFGGTFNYYSDIDIASDGTAYTVLSAENPTYKGFFRSSDDTNFVDITPTQYVNEYGRTVLDVNPNNENEVYYLVYMDDSTGNPGAMPTTNYLGDTEYVCLLKYTYLSGDGTGAGGLWQNLTPNLPTTTGGPFDKINFQGGYNMLVKCQPGTGNIFIGGTNLYFSTTGFTTSTDTRFIGGYMPLTVLPFFEIYPNHHPDNHDVLFSQTDTSLVLSASDGGVRRTYDKYASIVPWQNLNGGYFTSQYYSVTIDKSTPNDYTLLGGFQDNGNFITFDNNVQTPWVMPFNGDGAYNYIAANKAFYVMSIQLGKVVKMTLNASGNRLNFTRIDPIGPTRDDYLFINPLVVDEGNENMLYMPAGNKMYRQSQLTTLPLNGNYDSISTGWDVIAEMDTGTYITALAHASSPDDILYFGLNNGDLFKITNASSASPTLDTLRGSGMPNAYTISISIDPDDADKVMVAYSNYGVHSIYYTDDGGNQWGRTGGNLEVSSVFGLPPSVRSVHIMKLGNTTHRKYLVGTSIGLFSADSISTSISLSKQTMWQREGANKIGAAVVRHITSRSADGYAVIGTHGSGAFDKIFDDYLGIKKPRLSASLRAYPVPSHDRVYLDLPSGHGIHTAKVFDYLGRQVTQASVSDLDTQIDLSLESLTPGIYFIKMLSQEKLYTATVQKI